MTCIARIAAAAALVLACLASPRIARAETFHTCAGFVDSLPATITTQGVWCLRGDLSTSMSSGTAVTIAANNVTLDCNGYRIGGLAAGVSAAIGVSAVDRVNVTVRNCNIRGFGDGIVLYNGSGHRVADNRIERSGLGGIWIEGDVNNIVERNVVTDTGGLSSPANTAIEAMGHIVDNTVVGVRVYMEDGDATGIVAYGEGSVDRGNTVSGLDPRPMEGTRGVDVVGIRAGRRVRIEGNHLVGPGEGFDGRAIHRDSGSMCLDNTVSGFPVQSLDSCGPGNHVLP